MCFYYRPTAANSVLLFNIGVELDWSSQGLCIASAYATGLLESILNYKFFYARQPRESVPNSACQSFLNTSSIREAYQKISNESAKRSFGREKASNLARYVAARIDGT